MPFHLHHLFLLVALIPLSAHATLQREAELAGVWVGWQCPANVRPDMRHCAHFMLELHQRGGRICGAHTFATAGAERMDEGRAPSIRGDMSGNVSGDASSGAAQVMVTSGRAPVQLRVTLQQQGKALIWQRLESPPGDYLLPQQVRLYRSRSKTLLAPVFAQELEAVCNVMFDTPQVASPAPASPPVVNSP